ncbi:THO complex subunit 2 [Hyphodiscus hymeniophilus]|uniref:THO complex subunit 2 n=1 Tax=Hyphodiscus hymeniophilus TaxID=353542 RepID=A0A9P6VF82_9HELO|nr:THO complex subunit 2 [Hyphodiscus hymeniophilus]
MPPKRKRTGPSDGESRPSPHRPANMNLGQYERGPASQSRRSSQGGQGGQGRGRGGRKVDSRDNLNSLTVSARTTPTPGPMSPPARPSSATQTPIPAADLPSPVTRPSPTPFDYVFLTDERISSWVEGRQAVVAAGVKSRQDEDTMDLATIFQELIRATLDLRIDATDAGNCVKEILGPDTALTDDTTATFDAQTLFIDTLSMICDAEDEVNPVLRNFVVATGISSVSLRQKLDSGLLPTLGLTRFTFVRVGIRQATHLLYRQANYNLLREETEGYSKLLTELFTTSGSEPPSAEVVEEAFEKMKGLIGTFDLDVGRVLDITLDVFAAVLVKHYRFFIKLLRVSSWWPRENEILAAHKLGGLPKWALPSSPGWTSTDEDEELSQQQRLVRDAAFWQSARQVGLDAFFELGGRQAVDAESKKRLLNGRDDDAELDADRQWIEGTGTFPPCGNRVAAQLLGFKLRFYASPARDNDDVLPPNLIYLTALLIKIGFISLRDLYPHLWPLDEDMEGVREKKMKELQEKEKLNRPGGGANALMTAGALPDESLPNGGRTRETATKVEVVKPVEKEDVDKLDEPSDTKVLLLVNLLTIGALPEALFIIGRFPWLPEAYPELFDLIHRILNHSINGVYNTIGPSPGPPPPDPECANKQVPDYDQNGVPKGQVRLTQLPTRKQLRWPFPDKYDTNENHSYRFYWDEWDDNIPVCQSVDDVFTLCGTLLNYSGVNIGRDAFLLTKLARIGAKSLSEDRSQHNLERWQDLLKRLLVPALSFTKSNTSAVNEVYDMLRFYPVAVRYSIYAEWFEGQTSRLPAMRTVFARTRLETLGIMKRISMTNITLMARSLAKTAYASPGIVFTVALNQIESYNNLTEVVVECAKYFTDLGYDVLLWSLMSSLGGKDRNRSNPEFPLLPSRWLLALSRFSGKVFKRYSIMNISPIIQYVNNQLYLGIPNDLVILKELIAQMAGIVPDTDFTDAQLTALTGGEVLRQQTLINLQDKRYESTKTAKRLMKGLVDTNLAGQLLLSIAQHRQSAIYGISDDDAAIKFLSTMTDDAQLILFQYLDLLRSNLGVEDFDRLVPSIPELLTDFGLDPSLAFMIGRASLTDRISKISLPIVNGTSKSPPLSSSSDPKPNPQDDMDMDGANHVLPNGDSTTSGQTKTETGTQASTDVQMEDIADVATPQAVETDADPFREILQPIISIMEGIQPDGSWDAISAEFYVTFWASQLSDLSVPSDSYQAEVRRIMEKDTALSKDRSDMSRPGMIRKDEAKKALEKTRVDLMAELSNRVTAYKTRKSLILKHKSTWFDPNIKADVVSDAILEKCILPRLLLSPSDADYCFRMIKMLHENGTPNFRTLSLYGRLLRPNRLRALIFSCTLREAENLGRFLRLILKDLSRWHADRKVYEKEAWGSTKTLLGFAKAINTDGTPKSLLDHDGATGFKNILYQWHKNLNIAIRDCLEGTEWMHIRNAATILKTVLEVFPAVDFMGNGFVKQLETVAKREKDVREDLSLPANAVLVQLKKRSKMWIMVQAFNNNISPAAQANGTTGKAAQTNGTPSKSSLKPTAAEFKPGSRASSVSASTPKATATAEVEDGEVDDAKTVTDAANTTTNVSTGTEIASATKPSTAAPPKSDVLLKREQILREREAAKAAATSAPALSRSEPSRNVTPGLLPERSSNLPSRPDAPIPPHRMLHQQPRHGDRRDGRDSRDRDSRIPDPNRLDRPSERSREFAGNDRRDPSQRDFPRPLDREPVPSRDRLRPDPPPRWNPDSARENAERAANNNRNDNSGRLSRETNMPPPRSLPASTDRGAAVNPARLDLVNSERQELINPERAALISGGMEPSSRSDSPRRTRDDPRDKASSRPQSPRRHGPDRDHPEARRDDPTNRNGSDPHASSRRVEEPHPPAGPRSERPTDRASDWASSERPRDFSAFQSSQPSSRQIDPDHGRLNSTSRPQPDPNFGRLNPTPTPDVPSGPRGTPRGNRMSNAPPPAAGPPRRDGRLPADTSRATSPEKQVPTGPSSTRHPRRSASGQFDQHSIAAGSAPSTPISSSLATAIHPDRLKHLGPQVAQPPSPTIHPDRLKAIGETAPPSFAQAQSNTSSRPPFPSVLTGGPPSGPKGSQSSPVSSGPNGLTAPTGPASAVERAPRGRRQIAGINTMLQQGAQQNGSDRMNIRGRNSRMSAGMQPETPNSAPSTPIIPPPPPGPPPGRLELSRDLIIPERADLITGGVPGSSDERERDRNSGRRERSGRHSRRGSEGPPTSSERTRDLKRTAPDDDRSRDAKRVDRGPLDDERSARGEHRDRRGAERDSERERHPTREPRESARDPGRDMVAGRENGRDRERERDRERDPTRREGRDREPGRDAHDVGYTGFNERGLERGGDRSSGGRRSDMRSDLRGEERRENRGPRDEAGRKRRSDGDGMERGHDKRPRR